MIKQIQLRGISRVPSDRMNEDGGLAESANMMIDHREQAPMPAPVDVTEEIGLPDVYAGYEEGLYFFVHRTSAYTNYFVRLSKDDRSYISACVKQGETYKLLDYMFDIDVLEKILSTVAIGNTVIIVTDKDSYYLLFKDGAYKTIGNGLPEVDVQFTTTAKEAPLARSGSTKLFMAYEKGNKRFLNYYNNVLAGSYDVTNTGNALTAEHIKQNIATLEGALWDGYNNYQYELKTLNKKFTAPVFVRYALRLYDDSYIMQSVPVLLGAGVNSTMNLGLLLTYNDGDTDENNEKTLCVFYYAPADTYTATAKLLTSVDVEQWKDVIKGIDIFLSKDLNNPPMASKIKRFTEITSLGETSCTCKVEFDYEGKTLEDLMTEKSEFYKVASYDIEDLAELSVGVTLEPKSQDMLSVETRLKDDENSHYRYTAASRAMEYAERLVLAGVTAHIPESYPHFPATRIGTDGKEKRYTVIWYTNEEGGFKCARAQEIEIPENTDVYAYLSYPSAKCYKAEIISMATPVYWSFTMKEHPLLNTSYYFGGLDAVLLDNTKSRSIRRVVDEPNADAIARFIRKRLEASASTFTDKTKLLMSESANPFLFVNEGRLTFAGDVLDVASATINLEHLQSYAFYVFTSIGIYLAKTNGVGIPIETPLVSRDIVVSGSNVTTTQQAVVYFTERGINIISGSQVQNISDAMMGKKEIVTREVRTMLENHECFWVLNAVSGPIQFAAWLRNSKCLYDYAGARLIFFMPNFTHMMVYDLAMQTWHTMATGLKVQGVVASFPEALVSVYEGTGDICKLYSLSLPPVGERTALPQVIYTRAFDLGETDVRKVIKDIRLRGDFDKAHARYILLGSMDGREWKVLSSLRGGSWKMFRMVILGTLTADERLSWIDIDYETRFANRLR